MTERVEMTVKMQVTKPQGLALKAMFEHWNKMSNWGCSRDISFHVDGDGNFHPKAEVTFDETMPELTEDLATKAICNNDKNGNIGFDFDSIAWALHD